MPDPPPLSVLVVEDDTELLAFAMHTLRRAGHAVVGAPSAEAAQALIAGGTPVDLVVSDIVLPGASGLDMVAHLTDMRPDLPVLFTTGQTEESLHRHVAGTGHPLLPKPYRASELCEAVDALVAPPGPRR